MGESDEFFKGVLEDVDLFPCVCVCVTATSCLAANLWIAEEQAIDPSGKTQLPKYSRFEGGSQFIGHGHDFSGVGRTTVRLQVTDADGHPQTNEDGRPTWSKAILDYGTLISASFHLAAHHNHRTRPNLVVNNSTGRHPEARRANAFPSYETVRYYHADVGVNDDLEDAQNFEQSRVTQNWWAGNRSANLQGDVEIGQLRRPVSAAIAVYPILLFEDRHRYIGIETFCFGKPGSLETSQRHQRACKRSITAVHDTQIAFFFTTNTATAPPLYGHAVSGDSGSPSLTTELGAGPVLAGTHWWPGGDNAITTTNMRDAMRQEMLDAQVNVPAHEREVPTYWTELEGDFNGSFDIDAGDLDILTREVNYRRTRSRGYNWYLDTNSDKLMTDADVNQYLSQIANSVRGDANLDRKVDAADMNIVGQNWLKTGKGWADGDFNGDGVVNSADLNEIGNNWQWGVE